MRRAIEELVFFSGMGAFVVGVRDRCGERIWLNGSPAVVGSRELMSASSSKADIRRQARARPLSAKSSHSE
jgi:hypothetical protein